MKFDPKNMTPCSLEMAVSFLLNDENLPVSETAADFLARQPQCSHKTAISNLLNANPPWLNDDLKKTLASTIFETFETAEILHITMPWFTCIVQIQVGSVAYVTVQAGDLAAAEDAALDAVIEQHQIDADYMERLSILGIFEGAAPCLSWRG